MKTLVAASFCAYSSFFSPEIQQPTLMSYRYPELPDKIKVTNPLVEEISGPDSGVFNQIGPEITNATLNLNQSAYNLALMTKAGSSQGFGALITALRLSGIEINHGSIKLKAQESRNQGLSFPYWYLQLIYRGDANDANISLKDLAQSMAKLYKQTPAENIEDAILTDIQSMHTSGNPGLRFFISYLDALNSNEEDLPSFLGTDLEDTDQRAKIKFSSLQLALLTLKLEADIGSSYPENLKFSRVYFAEACGSTSKGLVNNPDIVKSSPAFGKLIKITEADNADNPIQAKKSLDRLTNFVKSHSAVLKLFTAKISKNLIGGAPLIRTKNKTAGEKKVFELTFSPRIMSSDELQCFKTLAMSSGIIVNFNPGQDFLEGTKVKMGLEKTFDIERLFYDLGNGIRSQLITTKIDAQGKAKADVMGMPQDRQIPASAKPIIVNVPVKIATEVELLKYLTPDPARREEVVLDALLELEKLSNKDKIRGTVSYIPVRDWVEKPEGTIALSVGGHYADSESKNTQTSKTFTKISANHRSRMWVQLGAKSVFSPGWPQGVPLPPGMPEEMTSPSLHVMDNPRFFMSSDLKKVTNTTYECDVCRPEDGWADLKINFEDKKKGGLSEVQPNHLVVFPMKINRNKRTISTSMAVVMTDILAKWRKNSTGRSCPNNPEGFFGESSGQYQINDKYEHTFEVEINYEEIDGVAVVKKGYEVDFGYTIEAKKDAGITIPAKMMLSFDFRIPLL